MHVHFQLRHARRSQSLPLASGAAGQLAAPARFIEGAIVAIVDAAPRPARWRRRREANRSTYRCRLHVALGGNTGGQNNPTADNAVC